MNKSISIDFVLRPSEEVKICFSCPKKKCTPVNCNRLKAFKRKEREKND